MAKNMRGVSSLSILLVFLYLQHLAIIAASVLASDSSDVQYFKPFNVTYDSRALIVDGKRRILISAEIHYPRATPQMWPDLIEKSKEGGVDVIQTYVFWNGHEPVRGQYNFQGRYDLVKFVRTVGSNGLYLHLRIGPYVCAEWNFGGFPVWLRDIPGIVFRTDNEPFKVEMQRFVIKIVELMRKEKLFSWQGGPIIMLQIENEYGNFEASYGKGGKSYVKWAANLALGLGAGVPWVMCQQDDAPDPIIGTCNAYYCDGFKPASDKPKFWMEDWNGGFATWGGKLPHRPVEDIAFAIARFFQRGGSFHNFYMYFGGTNFGRTAGGPFYITSYDYDAPIDEYGLLSQPKWGHLKELHAAIKLSESALISVDSAKYIKLGPNQEAHVYGEVSAHNSSSSVSGGKCAAFLANIDERKEALVAFLGRVYTLPPWSVSILPDCRTAVYNTAKVGTQTSLKTVRSKIPHLFSTSSQNSSIQIRAPVLESWTTWKEPIEIWSESSFTFKGILEHLNVTKDHSDYLWHFTRLYVSADDIALWKKNDVGPTIVIDSMRDILRVFVNGSLTGSTVGHWVKVELPVEFKQGYNELVLLTQTVGLQNYGAYLEQDGAGFKGRMRITGLSNADIHLSDLLWTYQVGLKGEDMNIYNMDGIDKVGWANLDPDANRTGFTWYKTYFESPAGSDPVALDLGSMGKGQAWVNGHHIGRYWNLQSPESGCQETCDYRGAYNVNKCTTNCGKPTQIWYHVPRAWLTASNNLLVIFEEVGGNPFEIAVKSRYTSTICSQVSESHYPPIERWSYPNSNYGEDIKPELHLKCDDGYVISSIEFASYGTPQGRCQKFSIGKCHAHNSLSVVLKACQGKTECSIGVSNAEFGGDPCRGVLKTLSVKALCASIKTDTTCGRSSF